MRSWWAYDRRPLPLPPTRAQMLDYRARGQGVLVDLPRFRPTYGTTFPWWDAGLAWFTPDERQILYAAKHAVGDTHAVVDLPMGWALYDEPGQAYSVQNGFGPLDLTAQHTTVAPAFLDLLLEVVGEGFLVDLVLDEHLGYSGASAYLPTLVSALQHAEIDLTRYCLIRPGWDGIWYGWLAWQIDAFGRLFRSLAPDGYLAIEFATGLIHLGNGPADWAPGGAMQAYDLLLGEFDQDRFDDSVYQVLARAIGPAYRRPPEQPPSDDPGAPFGPLAPDFYLHYLTPRGPYAYRVFEFWMYPWVRIPPGDPIAAITSQQHVQLNRDRFVSMGAGYVC